MSVKNVERQEKNKVKLTIEISAEAFEAAIEKVYRKNKGQIAIPGFRKGKACLLYTSRCVSETDFTPGAKARPLYWRRIQ